MRTITLLLLILLSISSFSQGKFFGGNGDGFATATITNIVLPLQVVQFNVVKENNKIKANLQIQSTDAVCGLQLHVSVNGNNFRTVDSVTKDYPGFSELQFELTDVNPAGGNSFYRAKIIRCDGSFVYSKVVLSRNEKSLDKFYVANRTLYYTTAIPGYMEVVNNAGQVIKKQLLSKGSGTISLDYLPAGVYYLRFEGAGVKAISVQ